MSPAATPPCLTLPHRLFLAPHRDDVAFSVGGLAAQPTAGTRAAITVFGGAPATDASLSLLTQRMLGVDGKGSVAHERNLVRAAEDRAAMKLLGVELTAWDEQEATFRGGYEHPLDIFLQVSDQDAALVERITERLLAAVDALGRAETLVVAPLGVGHHVDHVVVHRAARALAAHGVTVAYYEDYPYADPAVVAGIVNLAGRMRANPDLALHDQAFLVLVGAAPRPEPPADPVAEHMRELGLRGSPIDVEIGATLDARVRASELYPTQLADVFGSGASPRALIEAFASARGAGRPIERLWMLS